MSAIPDFISNPNYISLFMIWASGYVFAYATFRKSSAWKNFDSIMKMMVGLVLGFIFELVVIIPLFYSVTGGLATLSAPTLNITWPFHSLLILGISYLIYKNNDIPRAINHYFGELLLWVFAALTAIFCGLTISWFSYADYLKVTTNGVQFFTFSLAVYSALGTVFCYVFPKLASDAYSNHLKQKRLDSYFSSKPLIRTKTMSKNIPYIALLCIIIVSLATFPIDQTLSVTTPNVSSIRMSEWKDGSINLYVGIAGIKNGIPPTIDVNYSKTVQSYYTITPAKIGGTHSVIILLPSYLASQSIQTGGYYGIYGWGAVSAFPQYANISVQTVPISYGDTALNVTYADKTDQPFNVSLAYWKSIEVNDVSITAQPAICNRYNDTLFQWIYKFTIENHDANYISIKQIQVYDHIYNNENGTAVSVKVNGVDTGGTILDTKIALDWAYIPVGKTFDVEVSYLSPNSI